MFPEKAMCQAGLPNPPSYILVISPEFSYTKSVSLHQKITQSVKDAALSFYSAYIFIVPA